MYNYEWTINMTLDYDNCLNYIIVDEKTWCFPNFMFNFWLTNTILKFVKKVCVWSTNLLLKDLKFFCALLLDINIAKDHRHAQT